MAGGRAVGPPGGAGLRRLAKVAMVQASDFWKLHDRSSAGPDSGQADPDQTIHRAKLRARQRSLVDGKLLAKGEVLKGELTVTAEEEGEEPEQLEQEGDHRAAIVAGPGPADNHLAAGRGFGEAQGIPLDGRSALADNLVPRWLSALCWEKSGGRDGGRGAEDRRFVNEAFMRPVLSMSFLITGAR
jgi:hypothetical protein